MYAIVETGGKQYKVNAGQLVDVEQLPQKVGEKVELAHVMAVVEGENVRLGNPLLTGAVVRATVAGQVLGSKVRKFRCTGKKTRRRVGHRQHYTRLHIDEIAIVGKEE